MGVWLLTMRQKRHSSRSWKGVFNFKRNYEVFRFFFVKDGFYMTLSSFVFQDLPEILGCIHCCNPTKFSLFAPLSLHIQHTTIFWERRCDLFLFEGFDDVFDQYSKKILIRNHSKLFGYFGK